MTNNKNSTKVVTGIVRLSYEHVWEPASINGSTPKYSASLIIPKSDKKTIDAINTAIDNAIRDGAGKFGGKIPNKAALKLPLRDGDIERDDEAYKGCYFVNANSTSQPQISLLTKKYHFWSEFRYLESVNSLFLIILGST